MIDDACEAEILRLYRAENWPIQTIAGQLGIHHGVVRRVLRQSGQQLSPRRPRPSQLDPFVPFIEDAWARWPKLTASRLYRMCKERGYVGRPDHFRHMVARLRPRRPREAFLRLKTLPGEQAQVDWAHFGHTEIGRAQRPVMGFVVVLSYSRAIYLRYFFSQSTEDFLRGHQEGFSFFGGVPRILLYDNLKSVVLERKGRNIRFNPLTLQFAGHHGYEARPVAVRRGNEKGRVERAIRFIRADFFLACPWRTLEDLNEKARAWCQGPAMERRWPQDGSKAVKEVFEKEQKLLLGIPENPFPIHERREVVVGKTPYVRFDKNDYSVPASFVRSTLCVVATPDEVLILSAAKEVARHTRSYDKGQQIEDRAHISALVSAKARSRKHRGMDRLSRAAPKSTELIMRLAENGENLGSCTARLLTLLDTFGAGALERAIDTVLKQGVAHVAAVRQVLLQDQQARGKATLPPFSVPERVKDLVVRPHPLCGYDQLANEVEEDITEGEKDGSETQTEQSP